MGRASPPGSVPFGHFKNAIYKFLGGYLAATTGFTSSTQAYSAGHTDGMMSNPMASVVDSVNGYIYVSDQGNSRILKFKSNSGTLIGAVGNVTKTAGTCTALGAATSWCLGGVFANGPGDGMFSSPSGLALDAGNDLLYVADSGNNRITKLKASTGAYVGSIGNVSIAGGTCTMGLTTNWCNGGTFSSSSSVGSFNAPNGLAVDTSNQFLFVADSGNSRIVKVNATTGGTIGAIGNIITIGGSCSATGATSTWCTGGTFTSGNGDGKYNSPYGLAVDNSNDALYVADSSNFRVVKITESTGGFAGAIGYMSSSTGTCPSTNTTSGWCTGGTAAAWPKEGGFTTVRGITVDSTNGYLYASDSSAYSRVMKFNLGGGAFLGSVGLNNGSSTGTCPSNAVATTWCTGATSWSSGSANGAFNGPSLISIDVTGNTLYVPELINQRLTKLTLSTGLFQSSLGATVQSSSHWMSFVQPGPGNTDGVLYQPRGAAYDPSTDALYVADTSNHRILKFNATTGAFAGAIGKTVGSSTGSCPSSSIATGWCTGGTFTSSTGDGGFTGPSSLTIDIGNQILYIADTGNSRVVKVNASSGAFAGAIGYTSSSSGTCIPSSVNSAWCIGGLFQASSLTGGFNSPYGITYDSSSGNLYVADTNNSRIQRFSASSGAFSAALGKLSASGACGTSGITLSSWCSSSATFSSGTSDGAFSSPKGLSTDSTGLYVADTGNNRIQKINLSTGSFSGAIGRTSASSGSCPASGTTSSWCTGGTFSAGSADGQFNAPSGLVYDSSGYIYVADTSNNRVARILSSGMFQGAIGLTNTSTGTCPTALNPTVNWCSGGTFTLGSGDGMFSSPSTVLTNSVRHVLYVVDTLNHRIEQVPQ